MDDDIFKMDKTAFSVGTFEDSEREEKEFWLSRTPEERFMAVEYLRQMMYGYNPLTVRMEKVLTVVTLKELNDLEHLP